MDESDGSETELVVSVRCSAKSFINPHRKVNPGARHLALLCIAVRGHKLVERVQLHRIYLGQQQQIRPSRRVLIHFGYCDRGLSIHNHRQSPIWLTCTFRSFDDMTFLFAEITCGAIMKGMMNDIVWDCRSPSPMLGEKLR
jgi:hypothetical protein